MADERRTHATAFRYFTGCGWLIVGLSPYTYIFEPLQPGDRPNSPGLYAVVAVLTVLLCYVAWRTFRSRIILDAVNGVTVYRVFLKAQHFEWSEITKFRTEESISNATRSGWVNLEIVTHDFPVAVYVIKGLARKGTVSAIAASCNEMLNDARMRERSHPPQP